MVPSIRFLIELDAPLGILVRLVNMKLSLETMLALLAVLGVLGCVAPEPQCPVPNSERPFFSGAPNSELEVRELMEPGCGWAITENKDTLWEEWLGDD